MLNELSSADFQPLLQQTFQASLGAWDESPAAGAPSVPLRLSDVAELPLAMPYTPAGRRPFSLIFHQPDGAYLPQQTYALEHVTLGRLPLFLVPIGPDAHGMRYEAIFT
jgi:hypothetical protein